jgi:ParB-like chromosome segregation protein Spo0J
MTPTFEHIDINDVDLEDKQFIVTYRPQLEALEQSIARMGVLTPVHLRRTADSNHLQLICGFKRLLACRNTAQSHVPALIYDANTLSAEQTFLLALYDNLGCRDFNAVEKGRILQRLRDVYHYDSAILTQEICPLLNLPPRLNNLQMYCTLAALDAPLQQVVAEARLPLETALWIGRQAADDRQILIALFTGLRLSRNRAREFAGTIEDLCRRDACSISECLHRLDIETMLVDTQISGPQKIERLRHALQQARHPLLNAHQQRFRTALHRLQLPAQVELQPPPYFEGDSYRVTFTFNSQQQLQHAAQGLSAAAADDGLDDLLALL